MRLAGDITNVKLSGRLTLTYDEAEFAHITHVRVLVLEHFINSWQKLGIRTFKVVKMFSVDNK